MDKVYYEQHGTEENFLAWYKEQDHPTYEKPSLTVDNVILSADDNSDLHVLLIKRKAHPYKDTWALPGGFVSSDENTDEACLKETEEETGVQLTTDYIEQLYTFSEPGRDPRAWIVSVAYLTFLPEQVEPVANDDAKEAVWAKVYRNTQGQVVVDVKGEVITIDKTQQDARLAFDHAKILTTAVLRLAGKLDYEPNVLRVLGHGFRLTEARHLFKQIEPFRSWAHNSNFIRTHGKFIEEAGETSQSGGRPARLFRLKG